MVGEGGLLQARVQRRESVCLHTRLSSCVGSDPPLLVLFVIRTLTNLHVRRRASRLPMVIPPPNVTGMGRYPTLPLRSSSPLWRLGTLHLGHALTNAIEDSLVRW